MDNSCKAAVSAAIAGGYLLGRTRNAKLAFAVATYLAGRRFSLSASQLAHEGLRQIKEHPDLADLREQVRDELLTARSAASGSVDRRFASMASALRERGAGGRGAEDMEDEDMQGEKDEEDEEDEDAPEDMGEEMVSEGAPLDSDEELNEDEEEEPEQAPRHRAQRPHGHGRPERSARRAATRQDGADDTGRMRSDAEAPSARKSTPGKKAAARKQSANKSAPTGQKAAPRRTPGQKTAAGRSPSRSNQRGR
jgi:hypothetical protein